MDPPGRRLRCGRPPRECHAGKHPLGRLVPNRLDGATADEAAIRRWFSDFPDADLAARTGPESNLLVLDIDGPEGETTPARLERQHGALPDWS